MDFVNDKSQLAYGKNANLYEKVNVELIDMAQIIERYQKKDFIISFYGAGRLAKMNEPKNPTKPNLQIRDIQ